MRFRSVDQVSRFMFQAGFLLRMSQNEALSLNTMPVLPGFYKALLPVLLKFW